MLKKTIPILLLFLFISCEKSNSYIESHFENEFNDSIRKLNGKHIKVQIAPDWKADVYYLNAKPRMFFYQTMPENGFTSKRVYINADNDNVEKIIYRTCLPDFTKNDDNYELIDSIFEIYPRNGFIIRYFNDQRIDSVSDTKRINTILKEVKYIQSGFELHNSR